MPEIKQPEQLSLGLEDTRKGLLIDMEKISALRAIYLNIPPFNPQLVPRAPQPAREREQRIAPREMHRWNWIPRVPMIIVDDFAADARLEVHVGQMPEYP